jgi:hypothetical protein
LPDDLQRAVSTVDAEVADVGLTGFADPEAVQTEQRGERGVLSIDPLGTE